MRAFMLFPSIFTSKLFTKLNIPVGDSECSHRPSSHPHSMAASPAAAGPRVGGNAVPRPCQGRSRARELAQPHNAQAGSLGRHSGREAWDLQSRARPPSCGWTVAGAVLYVPQRLLQSCAGPDFKDPHDVSSFSLPGSGSVHPPSCVLGSCPGPRTCSRLPSSGSAFRRNQRYRIR